jgi:hypothetical protein
MAYAWWNLALRFALELTAVAGFAVAGWRLTPAPWHWVVAIALPLVAIALWGTFAVPDDPSRSGGAPVPVTGRIRLGLELIILFGGAFALVLSGYREAGIALAVLTALHYAISVERIIWLIGR